MLYLDLADFCTIAEAVVGIPADVLSRSDRVITLADPALHAPESSFGGVEFFPSIEEKGGILCYRLINNHPLPDGNKRTAFLCLNEFLDRNGARFELLPDDTADDVVNVLTLVASRAMSEAEFTSWLAKRILPDAYTGGDIEGLTSRAWRAFDDQRYDDSVARFGAVAERRPSVDSFLDLAFALLAARRPDEASNCLRTAEALMSPTGDNESLRARLRALRATTSYVLDDGLAAVATANPDQRDDFAGLSELSIRGPFRAYGLAGGGIVCVGVTHQAQWTALMDLNRAADRLRHILRMVFRAPENLLDGDRARLSEALDDTEALVAAADSGGLSSEDWSAREFTSLRWQTEHLRTLLRREV